MKYLKYLKIPAIIISIIMSIGGAVNSGWTYFYFALPFMALFWFLMSRYGIYYRNVASVFIVLCILVSVTRDWNPLLYPILSGGTVTILQDGYHEAFSDGSGGFESLVSMEESIKMNLKGQTRDFDEESLDRLHNFVYDPEMVTITLKDIAFGDDDQSRTFVKLKKGDELPVTGIFHNNSNLYEKVGVITPIGHFYRSDINPDDEDLSIQLNKDTRSKWSKLLGNLMYYPMVILNLFVFFDDFIKGISEF